MQKQTHQVHFEDFSGQQFERLCFAFLVRQYPEAKVTWYGQVGGDKGRDIVCTMPTHPPLVVQCANVQRLTFDKIQDDMEKAATGPAGSQIAFHVICGGTVSAKLRDRIAIEAQRRGFISNTVWSGVEFEEQVRSHSPELLRRFLDGAEFPELTEQHTSASQAESVRSSASLEYQAALTLSAQDFGVSTNYSYSRIDGEVEKECTVDVRGVKGAGGLNEPGSECLFDVLIDCQYRVPGVSWLFFPTPKYPQAEFDHGLQWVDYFSLKFVHPIVSTTVYYLDSCFTSVEIGVHASEDEPDPGHTQTIETQLQHSARQLQYATPSLVALRARVASLLPPQTTFPFFFTSILVTNAPLTVVDARFDVAAVQAARNLEDIGRRVPFLLWSSSLGPDFNKHCQRQLSGLQQIATREAMRAIEARRRTAREAHWLLPSALAQSIAADSGKVVNIADFAKVFVANIDHLESLIRHLTRRFVQMATALKDEPFIRWQ